MNHLNHDATDRLSRCASALFVLAEALTFHHWETSAFGAPSECHADVNRGHVRDCRRVLVAHGYTVDAFEDEFASRVSGRCAHDILGEMCLPDVVLATVAHRGPFSRVTFAGGEHMFLASTDVRRAS